MIKVIVGKSEEDVLQELAVRQVVRHLVGLIKTLGLKEEVLAILSRE